jgi:Tfp pilus assembly protein PilO
VGSFLSEVANLDRIVNVTSLRLDANQDENDDPYSTVIASFVATAYTLNTAAPPAQEPAASMPGTGEKGANHAG